jgi:hypothetical protein
MSSVQQQVNPHLQEQHQRTTVQPRVSKPSSAVRKAIFPQTEKKSSNQPTTERYKLFKTLFFMCVNSLGYPNSLKVPVLERYLTRDETDKPFGREEVEVMLNKMEEDSNIYRNEDDIYVL